MEHSKAPSAMLTDLDGAEPELLIAVAEVLEENGSVVGSLGCEDERQRDLQGDSAVLEKLVEGGSGEHRTKGCAN